MPSTHELKRMIAGKLPQRPRCEGCDRRRRCNVSGYCAHCAIDRAEALALRGLPRMAQVARAVTLLTR